MAGPNILNLASKVVFLNGSPLTLPTYNGTPGGTPTAGDFYYNSSTGNIEFYNGTTWISVSSNISLTGQMLTNGNILVGNGSNVSASVAVTGDLSLSNAGVTALTATTNSTLTTLSVLSLPTSQLSGFIPLNSQVSGTLPPTNGGTGLDSFNTGDMLYGSASNVLSALPIGSSGQILTVVSGVPAWAAAPASGANTSLSNLTTTSINQSLIPATTNTYNLGSGTEGWAKVFAYQIYDANSNTLSIDAENRLLVDVAGFTELSWNTNGVYIGSSTRSSDLYIYGNDSSSAVQIAINGGAFSSYNFNLPLSAGSSGQVLTSQGGGASAMTWTSVGTGSVTSVSVVSANGFAGTVATATSTPAITIETTINAPVLAGNGTAISAATTTGTGSTVVLANAPTFAGAIDMGSFQINNLANGSSSGDAVNLGQLQAAVAGLFWQGPAQAFADSNVPLTGGATLTIDGYSVQTGDLVILGAQTTASQNGEYTVSGIGSTYVLTPNGLPSAAGDAWLVLNGTVYGDSAFVANAPVPTATFTEFAGPTAYTFTAPLSLSGRTVSIGQATTSTDGYLSSIDWNTFNDKQAAGNYITALTGDATASGPGSAALTLATVNSDVGSYALANITVNAKGLITAASASTVTGSGSVVLATSPSIATATLTGTTTAAAANFSGTVGLNDGITSTGALTIDVDGGAAALQIQALNVQRSTNGTNFITETYVDSTTLTDDTTAAVTAFQFAYASFAGEEITYVIESGDANADCRVGTIMVTANNAGTVISSIVDSYVETADCGVSWSAAISSGNVVISYTTTNQGAARTMRADVKLVRR